MSSWRALATSSSLSDLPLSGTPRYRRKDPRCVTCTPTASRAVVARHFRVEMDASQPCRRLWASRGAVIAVRSPATKMSIASNFCASLAGGYYLRVARQGSPGAVYISPTFTIAPTAAPNSNIVATTEAAATPDNRGNGNGYRHGGGSSTDRANPADTATLRLCLQALPLLYLLQLLLFLLWLLPWLLRLLLFLLWLLPRLPRLLPRLLLRSTTLSSHLHRASATGSSQGPLLRSR